MRKNVTRLRTRTPSQTYQYEMSPSGERISASRPVSSRTSRVAASSGPSPGSTRPFGRPQARSPRRVRRAASATSVPSSPSRRTTPPAECSERVLVSRGGAGTGVSMANGILAPDMSPSGTHEASGPLLEVDPLAVELGERFRTAGFQLFLVGGAVRDLLLKREPSTNLDFATNARPEQTVSVLQGWAGSILLVGIKFGTVVARKDGRDLDVTTFRTEVYPGDDRHPRVEFASELEVDLSRRDFTVNAMAVRLPQRAFVDPFGGLKDLAAKRLETPLEPEVSFGDDPLRMLRAARFASSL